MRIVIRIFAYLLKKLLIAVINKPINLQCSTCNVGFISTKDYIDYTGVILIKYDHCIKVMLIRVILITINVAKNEVLNQDHCLIAKVYVIFILLVVSLTYELLFNIIIF